MGTKSLSLGSIYGENVFTDQAHFDLFFNLSASRASVRGVGCVAYVEDVRYVGFFDIEQMRFLQVKV